MDPKTFFTSPQNTVQKQYEALRAFYTGQCSAKEAAKRFNYTTSSFYSLARDFKGNLFQQSPDQFFFISRKAGRKPQDVTGEINRVIITLRKKYLSVPDIKAILDVQGHKVSEKYVYNVIKKDGFARLPRRDLSSIEKATSTFKLEAPKTEMLDYSPETFSAQNALGILCLLPYIQNYGIDRVIQNSNYPETNSINRLSSIMSFVALKLSNVRRYTTDDAWCMDWDYSPGLTSCLKPHGILPVLAVLPEK